MAQNDRAHDGFALTVRALGYLLRYPDAQWRGHLGDVWCALRESDSLSCVRLDQIAALVDSISAADELDAEAEYVDLFDRGRGTALHLFEHVHGDSRERGPAMIDLIATYEQAGLQMRTDELPDHLTVLLEYVSTQPRDAAVALLGEVAHILQRIHGAIERRGSGYAAVIGALLDLAGARIEANAHAAEPEPDLDAAWEEPAAFDGCGNQGQQGKHARPGTGQAQPVHLVRCAPAADPQGAHRATEGVRA